MTGDDIGRIRLARDHADGPDGGPRHRPGCVLLHRRNRLGRGRQRISSQMHRRRARVIGDSRVGDPVLSDARDRLHDPYRHSGRLQDQRLLDMELEVSGDVPRSKHVPQPSRSVLRPRPECLEIPDAARVLHLRQGFQREPADHRL